MNQTNNTDQLIWYTKSGKELAEAVHSRLESIEESQSYLKERAQLYLAMYGNKHDFGIGAERYESADPIAGLTLNVVEIMIDTLASRVGVNRPRPYFLTDEGNWKQQEQAKKLNKFVYGQFHRANTYEKGLKAFLCASIFGTGVLKHYIKDNQIESDWVLPTEIVVDQKEAIYGDPKSLFQVRYIAREVLMERFPKQAEEIKQIGYETYDVYGDSTLSNMLKVVEAWHLPSGKKAKDGKHCITIKGINLFEEEYKRSKFPFSFYRVYDPVLGFYGKGVAEALAPIQLEINKTIKRIAESLHLVSSPRVFIERNSKIKKGHINNQVGTIVEYEGTPPIIDVARSVSPELAGYLENLYGKAFEVIGLSQLSAQSKKPAGLNSGKAIREYNDIETERFKRISKGYEDFYLDSADHYVELGKEIAENDKQYSILAIGKNGTEKIKFKEINLDRDAAVLQSYPTNMLPKEPAGRLEYTQELLQAGFIGQEEGLELLEFPDIKSVTNLRTSPFKIAQKVINGFLDGKLFTPDQYHANALILPHIQNALMYYETQNLDDDKLDLFRDWIDQALLLINPPMEQQTELEGEVDAVNEQQLNEGEEIAAQGELPPEQL